MLEADTGNTGRMTNKATTPDPGSTDPTASAEPDAPTPAGAPADVREQMRQALERKHGRAGQSHTDASGSKASSATANNTVHREFRRKSGG